METPVMLLFFNRPDVLRQSFAWVQRVKPKQLFLVQDGPRTDHPSDAEKVLECRRIVEDITWDCEVRKNYSERNLSCDVREFSGIDWCFQYVERLIILEDDCVPADSFYDFCGELLERYSHDNRINAISGFVRCGQIPGAEYDYVFSHTCAGWGWATWKRAWTEAVQIRNTDRAEYEKLLYKYKNTVETYNYAYKGYVEKAIELRRRESEAVPLISWENIWGLSMIFHNQMTISPRVNMIKYVGISDDATHSPNSVSLVPHGVRKMLTQPAIDIGAPLKHPPFVVRDMEYEKADYKEYFGRSQFLMHMEVLFLKMRYRLLASKRKDNAGI